MNVIILWKSLFYESHYFMKIIISANCYTIISPSLLVSLSPVKNWPESDFPFPNFFP
jgi:hypothetical protein